MPAAVKVQITLAVLATIEEDEKRKALREETHRQMQEFLSPEQMTKFEELKKQRHEKWQKRHEERKHRQPEVDTD